MPPHGDPLDGPVVTAARKALEGRDIDAPRPGSSARSGPVPAFKTSPAVAAL